MKRKNINFIDSQIAINRIFNQIVDNKKTSLNELLKSKKNSKKIPLSKEVSDKG